MKTAKRVLAIVVTLIMIVGTCAVAASALGTYQAQINAGATKITIAADTTETLTVKNDLVIDLNGHTLMGVMNSAAIIVESGNVTVTNGQVSTTFATDKPTMEMLKIVSNKCPAAISVKGGSLTVEGVRITGGQIRIPGSSPSNPDLLLAGSGIMSYNGAPVTIKRCSIYGDYGVNNAIRTVAPGGVVTVEDAIIMAYNTAIKGEYVVAEGSEEIDAADRIAGAFINGLDATKQELAENLLNGRTLIVSKTAEQLTAELGVSAPVVTIVDGESIAQINAPVLNWEWKNTAGTDCSYKLVPELIKYSDGTTAALDAAEAEYIDEDAQILYRVVYKVSDEAKPYIQSLLTEGLDNPLDGVLGWAGLELNSRYAEVMNANGGKVDTYEEAVAMIADVLKTVDSLGNKTVRELVGMSDEEYQQLAEHDAEAAASADGYIKDMPEYKTLQQKLYRIAGATGFNAKYPDGSYTWSSNQWTTIFGNIPEEEYVGTLDRIQFLKDGLVDTLGDDLFKNTAAYGDLVVWAVDKAYPQILAILDEVAGDATAPEGTVENKGRVQDLLDLLNTDPFDKIAAMGGASITDAVGMINQYIGQVKEVKAYIDSALKTVDVKESIKWLQDHKAELASQVNDGVYMIEHWRDYVDVKALFPNNGANAKTYATLGTITIERLTAPKKLHITVSGTGVVAYQALTNGTTDDEVNVKFRNSFTLTAQPADGNEFLFWAYVESGNYIISTEETFTFSTTLDQDIEAVFGSLARPKVYFTNHNGDICGVTPLVDMSYASLTDDINDPSLGEYAFGGWPGADEENTQVDVTSMDNEAYATGNSAFAEINAVYGEDGAIVSVRPESNNYIVTPKYSPSDCTVTFIDGDKVIVKPAVYGNYVTPRSDYENAYWIDASTGAIVCPTRVFDCQAYEEATYESREGVCPKGNTLISAKIVNNKLMISYYTTVGQVNQIGFSYSTSNTQPTLATDKKFPVNFVNKTHGIVSCGIPNAGTTYYYRPYVELKDGTIVESDTVIPFPAG